MTLPLPHEIHREIARWLHQQPRQHYEEGEFQFDLTKVSFEGEMDLQELTHVILESVKRLDEDQIAQFERHIANERDKQVILIDKISALKSKIIELEREKANSMQPSLLELNND